MEKDYPPLDQYSPASAPPPYQPDAYPPQPYPPQQNAPYPPQQFVDASLPSYGQAYPQQQYSQQQATTNVAVVTQPGATNTVVAYGKPPNYIALSLINLLCYCWPLGIVGLIYSLKVDSEYNAGRYEEARRASDSARNINYIGILIGSFLIIVYIMLVIAINVGVAVSNN